MKFLVLEQSDQISKIYKKIFDEKNYKIEFAKNEVDFFEKFDKNYDCVVIERNTEPLKKRILHIKPNQEILPLFSNLRSEVPATLKEAHELIEKPFAILTLLGKLEIRERIFR